ncbi:hypothetical protein EV361DRAFT_401114 [Lentinula raphanica]|nr:hypothetical protein EV361DRAFT_401114 [Lentinula raphanica]
MLSFWCLACLRRHQSYERRTMASLYGLEVVSRMLLLTYRLVARLLITTLTTGTILIRPATTVPLAHYLLRSLLLHARLSIHHRGLPDRSPLIPPRQFAMLSWCTGIRTPTAPVAHGLQHTIILLFSVQHTALLPLKSIASYLFFVQPAVVDASF